MARDPRRATRTRAPKGSFHQPADVDTLNLRPYVMAVADFLTHPATRPPLTVSVEGEWGAGKTSFMHQLRRELEERSPTTPARTVWFNAWRHDDAEQLWASFAVQFLRDLAGRATIRRRCLAALHLLALRYDWARGWRSIVCAGLRALLWLALLGAGLWVLLKGVAAWWPEGKDVARLAALLGVLGVAVRAATAFAGNPLGRGLGRCLRSVDYAARTSFLEEFHRDFARIVAAYAGKARVFVFIDDLDRCDVPKAADLLEALNLLLPQDEGPGGRPAPECRLFYILGMDREKVSAGLAVKYERILPYVLEPLERRTLDADTHPEEEVEPTDLEDAVAGGEDRAPADAPDAAPAKRAAAAPGAAHRPPPDPEADTPRRRALRFGYRFIEKFVQLPYRLPRPTEEDFARLAAHEREKHVPDDWQAFLDDPEGWSSAPHLRRMAGRFSSLNPRRFNRFRDLLRLRAEVCCWAPYRVADASGAVRAAPLAGRVRIEQLAKYVLLELRWPEFVDALRRRPSLLDEMVALLAPEGEARPVSRRAALPPEFRRWPTEADLAALLQWSPEGASDEESERWSMAGFPVQAMIDTQPPPEHEVARGMQDEVDSAGRSEQRVGPRPEECDADFEPELTAERSGDKLIFVLGDDGIRMDCERVPPSPTDGFPMGSPPGEGRENEHPQHRVRITRPLHVGVYPVTQQQYAAVMNRNPSLFGDAEDSPSRPVECVSWHGAAEFCRRLARATGLDVRLPTEAEWEYACRAGSTGRYCFDEDEARLEDYAWFGGKDGTDPVGNGRKPNAFGLYDVHGNVWEWCLDGRRDYKKTPPGRPEADPQGPLDGPRRVCRGGSGGDRSGLCRSAYRYRDGPVTWDSYLGFRVVVAGVDLPV